MDKQETKDLIKEVLIELREEGHRADCPFEGVEIEKIAAIKAMPTGAFKMLCLTWGIVAQFGNWLGKGIAVGLFIIVLVVLTIGGMSLLRLWGFIGGGK